MTRGRAEGSSCHSGITCPPLPAYQARGLKARAKSRTNFSGKVGDVVFGQIQNSHRLEQLNIRRNDLNQGIVYVPFFQVRLLPQRIWELLKETNYSQHEVLDRRSGAAARAKPRKTVRSV